MWIVNSCSNDSTTKENTNKELSESDVPPAVKSAFSVKYSTAIDVKWEDASENNVKTYKAKFTIDGKKIKAEFDETGAFMKEEIDN